MVDIGRVVYVSRSIIAAVRMNMASKIVVQVNRPSQYYRGLRHRAGRGYHLRYGDQYTLLQECTQRQDHKTVGDPSQARVQARLHETLLRQMGAENKPVGTEVDGLNVSSVRPSLIRRNAIPAIVRMNA